MRHTVPGMAPQRGQATARAGSSGDGSSRSLVRLMSSSSIPAADAGPDLRLFTACAQRRKTRSPRPAPPHEHRRHGHSTRNGPFTPLSRVHDDPIRCRRAARVERIGERGQTSAWPAVVASMNADPLGLGLVARRAPCPVFHSCRSTRECPLAAAPRQGASPPILQRRLAGGRHQAPRCRLHSRGTTMWPNDLSCP